MNKKLKLYISILVLIAFGVFFYFTPHLTISKMKKAAQNNDADTLSEYIDYPSVKESLKANINAMITSEVSANMDDNPFGAFGAALATVFINPMIDNLITPENLAMMMKGKKPEIEKPNDKYYEEKDSIDQNLGTTMSYNNFNSFVVTFKDKKSSDDPIKMIFKRNGIISWKLTSLRLPLAENENNQISTSKRFSDTGKTINRESNKQDNSKSQNGKSEYLGLPHDTKLGPIAPDFTLTDLEGRTVCLSDHNGKVVLINFWATWAPPCIKEMPLLNNFYQMMKDEDIVLLSISVDEGDKSKVESFMKKKNFNFPVLLDPEARIAGLYRTTGIPESFIIRKDGTVDNKIEGAIDWTSPKVIEYFQKLLKEPL